MIDPAAENRWGAIGPYERLSLLLAEIVLRQCPFESAARADRDTVCSLHLGLAEGLADETGVLVEELISKDPRRANCRLRLRVEPGT